MSKSLGNSPDPLELIKKYGADGVRVGMLLTSPAGNDLPFDEVLCEQGRNFSNKVWNALRLVKGWDIDKNIEQPDYASVSIRWFDSKLNQTIGIIDDHFRKYRISDALMVVYKLVWDDFCSWYLEMIKPGYQKPIDHDTYNNTIRFFESLMKLMHPFMPFVSEEIWHQLIKRSDDESIMISIWPIKGKIDQHLLSVFEIEKDVIISIRNTRKNKNIPQKEPLDLFIKKNNKQIPDYTFDSLITKLCNINQIKYVEDTVPSAISFIVKSTEFYIPLANEYDQASEIMKIEEELSYTKGFLVSVLKKLENERFLLTAPADVVAKERKKKTDAEDRILVLEEKLVKLKSK
jgi:valyl-tRNA synthetase